MKMRMQTFGEIEIDGERYDHDLVIERGGIRKRIKKPSKAYRAHYGHTPLSADEAIPWHRRICSSAPACTASCRSCPSCTPRLRRRG